jgi:hypothetical protein
MRTMKRRTHSAHGSRIEALPLQALYPVNHLARAMGVPHRRLQRLLKVEGVQVFRVGRLLLVPLTELEEKVPAVWESVKAVETFRRAIDDA